jgi:hypothetical protein
MFGNVMEEHTLKFISEKSLVVGDFIVSFSNRYVSSSLIISQREQLYCYTASEERSGNYKGNYVTSGLCK